MATRAHRRTTAMAIFVLALLSLFIGQPIQVNAQQAGISTFYMYYSHLNGYAVTEGQQVNAGDVIGYAGYTGYMDVKNVHLHFAFGVNPPWIQQERVRSGTSLNTDWIDPNWVLQTLGYTLQSGTIECGNPFGSPNPDGNQDFHNAIDTCGYSMNTPVTAVIPGKVVWTRWYPEFAEAGDLGHGKVVCVEVTLSQPLYRGEAEAPYVITSYEDIPIQFIVSSTPTPSAVAFPSLPASVGEIEVPKNRTPELDLIVGLIGVVGLVGVFKKKDAGYLGIAVALFYFIFLG